MLVVVLGSYYVIFWFAILVGIWRLRRIVLRPNWWPVWALALALSCVHAVYWSNLRMRAPIIPALAVIVAASVKHKTPVEPS